MRTGRVPIGVGARCVAAAIVVGLAGVSGAQEGAGPAASRSEPSSTASEADAAPESTQEVAGDGSWSPAPGEPHVEWAATVFGQGKLIAPREASDAVGGFFDQYEYTPNKDVAFPIELGVRDARLDVFDAGDAALFQLRLLSPTSNLGVSGPDIDQPFFDQRIETTTRTPAARDGARWSLDLDYARMRTEQLRLFPNTGGGALVFDDQTSESDRFFRDRTGFDGRLRRRSAPRAQGSEEGGEPGASAAASDSGLLTEIALRGAFQARDGLGQLRAHRDPVNDWLGLPEGRKRNVGSGGAGVLLGSAGDARWLVTLDYDFESLRWKSPRIDESDLGSPPPAALRPLGYVPDTDRSTGRIGLQGRVGEGFDWSAAYQVSSLAQVGDGTPQQEAAGLDDNSILTQSVVGTARWRAAGRVTLRADVDFDMRDDRIQRDTSLFNPTGGAQVDPFVDDWWRITAKVEGEWRFLRRNSVTLGVRYDDVSRSLDFAEPGGPRILPENALVADRTRMIDTYVKTRLRLWQRLGVRGEVGYRAAPETGYVTDLDDFVHGRLDLRYTLATHRPVAFTAFAGGDWGHNEDFAMVAGLGPSPPGPQLDRTFERWNVQWGVGVETSPIERLSLFASFVRRCLHQQSGLVTSSWQRYFQENGTPGNALTFTDVGVDDGLQKATSLVFGVRRDWSHGFDSGAAYTYTRAIGEYEGDASPELLLIGSQRRIENQTHVLDVEGGWRPTEGLRLLVGYRLQRNKDDVQPPQSDASAAPPIDRTTYQHTFTLGVTLDGRFFDRSS